MNTIQVQSGSSQGGVVRYILSRKAYLITAFMRHLQDELELEGYQPDGAVP